MIFLNWYIKSFVFWAASLRPKGVAKEAQAKDQTKSPDRMGGIGISSFAILFISLDYIVFVLVLFWVRFKFCKLICSIYL